MIALMLAAGVAATAAAQNINRVRELLEEMQQEVEMIEKRQAETATVVPVKTEPVESVADTNGVLPLDTLPTMNDAVKIVIYNDNTWKYMRDRQYVKDSAVYVQYWDTTTLFPYRDVTLASLPASVAIDLVDSLKCYHYPGKGKLRSKYGPRRRRQHQGVDIPLKMGEPVYAVFNGRVRISQYNRGGYGNLVVIRHDNGLETFSGHLSERLVQSGDWVEAGQIIGFCGSTGRSTGPHLHFETRYCGQTFDPERLIDFESGNLRRQTFLLKKSFFDIRSNMAQDFEDEISLAEEDQKAAAEKAAMAYHKIRSGDTLGAIAQRYGTTVSKLCSLNGITSKTTLRIGRTLRVR